MGDTKEQVIENLSIMTDVNQETIQSGRSNREFREEYIEWEFLNGNENGLISFYENKVSNLFLDFDGQSSLSDVFDQIGEPEYVKITSYKSIVEYINVTFVYKEGISIDCEKHRFFKSDWLKITPHMKVLAIYYYDPKLIGAEKFYVEGSIDLYSPFSSTYKWIGYGKYQLKMINSWSYFTPRKIRLALTL